MSPCNCAGRRGLRERHALDRARALAPALSSGSVSTQLTHSSPPPDSRSLRRNESEGEQQAVGTAVARQVPFLSVGVVLHTAANVPVRQIGDWNHSLRHQGSDRQALPRRTGTHVADFALRRSAAHQVLLHAADAQQNVAIGVSPVRPRLATGPWRRYAEIEHVPGRPPRPRLRSRGSCRLLAARRARNVQNSAHQHTPGSPRQRSCLVHRHGHRRQLPLGRA